MKTKKPYKYPTKSAQVAELKDAMTPFSASAQAMIRTQIYLNKEEHDFLQAEARRRQEPMAAIIRGFIDEKMEVPADAWAHNPMLQPTVLDPEWGGHEDSGLNHDHYLYGGPKKWIKVKGQWVEAPPLPDDYYENRASSEAYDRKIRELDESR